MGNEFVSDLFDSLGDLFVVDALAALGKIAPGLVFRQVRSRIWKGVIIS